MLKLAILLLISSSSISGTIDSGPTNISPTGELWVCITNVATLGKCDGEKCKGELITITPKIRITGSSPAILKQNESCARLY